MSILSDLLGCQLFYTPAIIIQDGCEYKINGSLIHLKDVKPSIINLDTKTVETDFPDVERKAEFLFNLDQVKHYQYNFDYYVYNGYAFDVKPRQSLSSGDILAASICKSIAEYNADYIFFGDFSYKEDVESSLAENLKALKNFSLDTSEIDLIKEQITRLNSLLEIIEDQQNYLKFFDKTKIDVTVTK